MKAVLIFNKSSDLSFIASDAEFRRHLHDRAIDIGLAQKDDPVPPHIDVDIAMQLFSPLVVSQKAMQESMYNPYHSVSCQNGMQFAFQQFEECVYMAVGTREDTEGFLHRQLLVLHRILTFLFGPCTEQLQTDTSTSRQQKRRLVIQLLNTWYKMYNEDQGFLLEAIEKLHVGVNHVLNTKCIKLLEASLTSMKAAGERDAVHAMLVVNSKLLSLFSSRSATELFPADILLVILLVNTTFPDGQEDVSLSTLVSSASGMSSSVSLGSRRQQLPYSSLYSPMSSLPRLPSARTGAETAASSHWEGKSYQSLPAVGSLRIGSAAEIGGSHGHSRQGQATSGAVAPTGEEGGEEQRRESTSEALDSSEMEHSSSSATSFESFQGSMVVIQDDQHSIPLASGVEGVYPPMVEEVTLPQNIIVETESTDSDALRIQSAEDSILEMTLENTEYGQDALSCETAQDDGAYEVGQTQIQKRHSFPAALHGAACMCTPHTLHLIEVMPGTVAIIVCEKPRKKFAPLVMDIIDLLDAVVSATWAQVGIKTGKQMQEALDSRVKKLLAITKKLKNAGRIEKLVKETLSAWELLKGPELQKYVDVGEPGSMPPRMETMATNLQLKVKELYRVLFLSSHQPAVEKDAIKLALEQLRATFNQELLDYKDYLAIKAHRNITMTTYYRYFPGLVHFMYVNRKSAQLTVPSINIPVQVEDQASDWSAVLKQQLWQMVPWIQTRLQNGYTSMVVRKGDFAFTYCLWFEDPMGNALMVQHPFRGSTVRGIPGILGGDFYLSMVQECFSPQQQKIAHCYELFCIHVGTAPTPYILRQCRKLATSLWGSSGESSSPISLL